MIRTVPDTGNAATIPLSALILRPQIRTRNGFDPESLNELAASIRANGLLQPILVTPTDETDRYFLIAGERRVLAAELAGLDEVPALIRTGTPGELATMQAVENLQRKDLAVLDLAEGLRALRPAYKTSKELAKALGKSAAWVSKHLALNKLSEIAHTIAAEHCNDVETILLVDQIAKLPATDRTIAMELKCLTAAQDGTLTRQLAHNCLAHARGSHLPMTTAPEADEAGAAEDAEDANDKPAEDDELRTITLRMAPEWADAFARLGGLPWLLAQIHAHA